MLDEYHAKAATYFSGARADYVEALPRDENKVILELGCGSGATGALAKKEGRCGTYIGVELIEAEAAKASQVLDRVIQGDIERLDLNIPDGSVDVLICSEVLEHLVDPWTTVRRLARTLKGGGLVFASSPNVASWIVLRELMRGRFEYTDFGVMDRTHLRWFTRESYVEMFKQAGIRAEQVTGIYEGSFQSGIANRINYFFMAKRPNSAIAWKQINFHGVKI